MKAGKRGVLGLGLAAGLALGTALPAWGQPDHPDDPAPEDEGRDVGLTIYSTADPASFDPQQFIGQQRVGYNPHFAYQVPGFGVVRDSRELDLEEGLNVVGFTDVAEFIDPTTVSLVDLSAQGGEGEAVTVMEQQFLFDLVSPEKLLEKYLDREVTIFQHLGDGEVQEVRGTLLSATQGRLVLRTDEGLRMVPWSDDIRLGDLPAGLITRPTLQWKLLAPQAGARQVRTAYQTNGLTWRSDYNLVLNQDDTQADLGAWVTILNLSGARYLDTRLKLIAGDVQRIQPQPRPQRMLRSGAGMEMAEMAVAFEEQPFFEYHLYTLPRRTDVEMNSTQQIALFPTVQGVNVRKVLVYDSMPHARHWRFPQPQMDRGFGVGGENTKVDVTLRIENREENELGIPLPAGKVRVYKSGPAENGAAGALEFLGEDVIDHTARNEELRITVGQAFDITVERKQMDFSVSQRDHWMEETYEIQVRNAKDQPQQVLLREHLYRWTNWQILQNSDPFKKEDAQTIEFEITLPPDGSKTVRYQVRYTW